MKNKIILLTIIVTFILIKCTVGPTLEKDGGTRFILALDYFDFLRLFAGDEAILNLKDVINETNSQEVKDFSGFINAFQKSCEKSQSDFKLASIFMTIQMRDKINFMSTNEEVAKVLATAWDETMMLTYNIIRIRLDRTGCKNATVKIANGNNIIIELPGNQDPERVQNLIVKKGEAGFWDTYDNLELFQYLNSANNFLDGMKFFSMENDTSLFGIQVSNPVVKNKTLFSILTPPVKSDGTLIPGSVIGLAQGKDTAEVKRILLMDTLSAFFPRDLKLLWSNRITGNDVICFQLIAAKGDRTGSPALDGSCIVNAKARHSKEESTLILNMNSEGARKWARFTRENISRQVAFSMDRIVYYLPYIQNEITSGEVSIKGNFTSNEAEDMAVKLNSGAYPVNLNLMKTETIEALK